MMQDLGEELLSTLALGRQPRLEQSVQRRLRIEVDRKRRETLFLPRGRRG
jgi:hypothetical protein